MDPDEDSKMFSDISCQKGRRREIEIKKQLIYYPIKKSLLNYIAIFLGIIIILLLFIYIIQLIILFNETKNLQKEKHQINTDNIVNTVNTTNKINSVNFSSIEQVIEKYVETLPKVTNDEILNFRKINSENILLDRDQYKRSENPDVSIIVTLNNQAHCIHKAIRSIQNQSLKNIEIIVSIDCSQDNSTETIKQYMKEDERIIIIEHDTKEGTMKNRNDGIRKAKGKYITIVDGDDALIQKDILKNAFNIATMGDLDVVEFVGNMYYKHNLSSKIHNHNIKGIIRQPELRHKFFDINDYNKYWGFFCRTIWGKLIKNEILQKTLEKLGNYTDDFIIIYEDAMITSTLYRIAQSYYLYKESGYFYSCDEHTGRFPALPNKVCKIRAQPNRGLDSLKYLNYFYDSSDDNLIERKVIYHEIIGINSFDFLKFINNLKDNFDMFYRVVDRLINSIYLSQNEKEKLKETRKEIENLEKRLKK